MINKNYYLTNIFVIKDKGNVFIIDCQYFILFLASEEIVYLFLFIALLNNIEIKCLTKYI